MNRYIVIDGSKNYAIQFLTVVHTDGTVTTRLQTVKRRDIGFVIKQCSFKNMKKAQIYADLLQKQSKSLGIENKFEVEKIDCDTIKNEIKGENNFCKNH